jgi:hypothetical protein
VLDHNPTHEDIRAFLGRLKTALVARGLVRGHRGNRMFSLLKPGEIRLLAVKAT